MTKRKIKPKRRQLKAVKDKCLDCGGNNKEVILCHIFDCPLWEWRCGTHISSGVYVTRINTAYKNYDKEFDELFISFGIKREHFLTGDFKYKENFETPKQETK